MNALHLIKRVRALSPDALIVATTSSGKGEDALSLAAAAGADIALSSLQTLSSVIPDHDWNSGARPDQRPVF
jgi:hypothetical protein